MRHREPRLRGLLLLFPSESLASVSFQEHLLGLRPRRSLGNCRGVLWVRVAPLQQGVWVASCIIWLTWQHCNLP